MDFIFFNNSSPGPAHLAHAHLILHAHLRHHAHVRHHTPHLRHHTPHLLLRHHAKALVLHLLRHVLLLLLLLLLHSAALLALLAGVSRSDQRGSLRTVPRFRFPPAFRAGWAAPQLVRGRIREAAVLAPGKPPHFSACCTMYDCRYAVGWLEGGVAHSCTRSHVLPALRFGQSCTIQ